MAKRALFGTGVASDPIYGNIRDNGNNYPFPAKDRCEYLWNIYEPYADNEFLTEIRKNFSARYWEMYLTSYLIEKGYQVTCPKPGPDVGIEIDGQRIWFEATAPERGSDSSADQVPRRPEAGVAYSVPNEKLILRYLNSISEKRKQHRKWIEKAYVSKNDAFIIALNPRGLDYEHADTTPPRILQVAYAIGSPYVAIDRKTLNTTSVGYERREGIAKASNELVATGIFSNAGCSDISALLCSRIDVVNQPSELGLDFQLAPNPGAKVQLPASFRLDGVYFRYCEANDSIIPEHAF